MRRAGAAEAVLRDAYAAADVFAFPNDSRQSWGLAPLEALAAGTPVIITTGAGVHEVLARRPGVTVIPEHDPAALARAIEVHMRSDHRSGAGPTRRWLEDELSVAAYAARMSALFERVTSPSR